MNIVNKIIVVLLVLFSVQTVVAQKVLTGTVRDAKTNEELTGANVYIMNDENRSLTGTVVDINGEYRLKVPEKQNMKVVFSYVGYRTKTIKYNDQTTLNIVLEEATTLNDIEVTAKRIERNNLGQTTRERVSAIQKVNLEGLETANVTNVTEALQGALANVDILTGADPGSGSSIRIRGTSSLSASSEPLFVMDGVPMPVNLSSDFNFATANSDDYSQLLNISPTDILSIEVLKDAAATALYGSKAANGALLITTKKGSKGKMTFTYSTKLETTKERNSIPMLNAKQYTSLIQDALWNSLNDVGVGSNEGLTYQNILQNNTKEYYELSFDPNYKFFKEYNQDVDWLDLITQNGYSYENNFSLSGGGEKAIYRLSLGHLASQGTTIGTNFKRLSGRFNMTYKFSDRMDLGINYSFTRGVRNATYTDGIDNSIRTQSLINMPNMSPYIIGDDGKATKEYFSPYMVLGEGFEDNKIIHNTVALANEARNQTTSASSVMLFNLHYKIFNGLDYYGIVGFQTDLNGTEKFLPQSVTGVAYTSAKAGLSTEGGSDLLYLTTENTLIFNKTFEERHKLLISAKWNTEYKSSSSFSGTTVGNPSDGITDIISGAYSKISAGSGHVVYKQVGGLLNTQYTFLDRYILNAGLNVEASSSLPVKTRWGAFPNVGVAWIFSDEPFLKDFKTLSMGKMRVNWGQSSNSPSGSAQYVGALSAITNGYMDVSAVEPIRVQLENIGFETISQGNIGIDFGFFNGKLNFSLDLYNKTTSNLLQTDLKVPSTTGYSTVKFYNSGSMENKGYEFMTDVTLLKDKNWTVSMNFNIAQNRNKIIDLPENKQDTYYPSFGNKNYAYKFSAGDPLGSFYGYKCLGVYQNVEETYARDADGSLITDIDGDPVIMKNGTVKVYPGDAKYADMNNDGIINKYDIVYIGNSNPLFIGGFGFNVMYKGFGITASFHGRAGQKVINAVRMNNEYMYGFDNQSTAVLRRWRFEGDDTEIPRALYGRGYNDLGSDRFLEDASFLRMKTLTLKYDLPKKMLQKVHIKRLQVYVTGYDLITLTKYKGQDPEIKLSFVNSLYPMYIDNASTPKPIRFAMGLNLNL